MADLQINYEKLHELAGDARTLKSHLNDVVPGLSDGKVNVDIYANVVYKTTDDSNVALVGNSTLSGKLTKFQLAWHYPFKDAMSKLDDLAELLDGVATKFFDMDGDLAGKASNMTAALQNSAWESARDQHDLYERTKDLMFQPSPMWDGYGHLVPQDAVPLMPWDEPVADPGSRPTYTNVPTLSTVTGTAYDDQGRVTSETSVVKSPSGLAYGETTTFTYEGDSDTPNGYTTTISHSDGTTETIVQHTNSDGTYTVADTTSDGTSNTTVTPKPQVDGVDAGYTSVTIDADGATTNTDVTNNPGKTPDTKVVTDDDSTKTYTGNSDYGTWDLVTDDPAPESTAEDPDSSAENPDSSTDFSSSTSGMPT